MGYVVRMPQMGMSMEEGTVVEWEVTEGESVAEAETVALVESEKTTADVEARESGVLRRTVTAEGETVTPGTPIGIVAAADEDLDPYLAEADVEENDDADTTVDTGAEEGATTPDTGAEEGATTPDTGAEEGATTAEPTAATEGTGAVERAAVTEVRASPGARRLATERGVDVEAVEGTGPEGVVVEADVRRAVDAERPAEATTDAVATPTETNRTATRTVTEERSLSRIQQTTADRLSESAREAPHVTLDRRVETEAVETVLSAAETLGVDVAFTDLVVAAAADALAEHPAVNALYEDGVHKLIAEVNVAVAVDADGDLLTPVVPDADALSVPELNRVRRVLTDRVLSGERSMDDLTGATFTVSNLGPFGVDRFSPIIDPPQVAILGVGRSRDGAVTLSLSFDHRVLNGAGAARFLDTLADTLTDADALAARFELDD